MSAISHLKMFNNYNTSEKDSLRAFATAPNASLFEQIKAASHSTTPDTVKFDPIPQFKVGHFSNS